MLMLGVLTDLDSDRDTIFVINLSSVASSVKWNFYDLASNIILGHLLYPVCRLAKAE